MKINTQKINALGVKIAQNIDIFIDHFGLDELRERNERIKGPCPIHNGDNKQALDFRLNDNRPGDWRCYTRECQHTFKRSGIGFVRGLLSRFEKHWDEKPCEENVFCFSKTLDFCCDKLNFKDSDIIKFAHYQKTEKSKFARIFKPEEYNKKIICSREKLLESISVPSKYYFDQYPVEILMKYDVGYCATPGKLMFERSVFPIYDISGENVIACTGRTIWPACECGGYHDPKTRCRSFKNAKWLHSKNIAIHDILYNYWFAKDKIKETGVVFLTESPGNILRLVEAGIENCVAMLGGSFSHYQRSMLNYLGVMKLIFLKDAGEAGTKIAENIVKQNKDYFKVIVPELNLEDDIGKLKATDLKERLSNYI